MLLFVCFLLSCMFLDQLLRDFTTGRSLTDEELLRQQEEFINKNIMQIERRRHERSLSPPGNYNMFVGNV